MSPLRSGKHKQYLYGEMPYDSTIIPNLDPSSLYAYLPSHNTINTSVNMNATTNAMDYLPNLLDSSSSSPIEMVPGGQTPRDGDDPNNSNNNNKSQHITMPVAIEMLKNLAACKEKQHKWEQSVKSLASYPDDDPNKNHLQEIIDLMEADKMSNKEKAIYLYEQLALKCQQFKNYIGAAKAYERAATLLFDIHNPNIDDEHEAELKASSTIGYLESAIKNYDAIHKYKHAGTLHYRCSCILRLIHAPSEQVEKHHIKALEYFTKPNHELKQRKRIDGLKISCYSSYSMARMTKLSNETDNFTTTTTTNTIKFHSDDSFQADSDESDESNHPVSPLAAPPNNAKNFNLFMDDNFYDKSDENLASNKLPYTVMDRQPETTLMDNYHQQPQQQPQSVKEHNSLRHQMHSASSFSFLHKQSSSQHHQQQHKSSSTSFNMSNSTLALKNAQRCIEDRIESARKLVKKLHKVCPFYEVSMAGEDAGRVYCHVCERFLGAVSSTLKNHANTQEHRQAYEDRQCVSQNAPASYPPLFSQPLADTAAVMHSINQSITPAKPNEYSNLNDFEQYPLQTMADKPNNVLAKLTNNYYIGYEGINDNDSSMVMATPPTSELIPANSNNPGWSISQSQASFDSIGANGEVFPMYNKTISTGKNVFSPSI